MAEGPKDTKNNKQPLTDTTQAQERLLQAYEIYNELADGKVSDFMAVKDYLSQTLEQLLQEGKIGKGVLLLSRIKSPASAVQNWKIGKKLYDIFGITLLTTTEQEAEEIREALRKDKKFNMSSNKQMNEKRGYEAIHFLFHVGEDGGKKTKVECHMQTHEAYKNVYPHIFYKVRRKLNRDLTKDEEKQIEEKIQQMYISKELSGHILSHGRKSRLPQMWVKSFNAQGKMQEQELTEDMILKIMYPCLDLSKKKAELPSSQGESLTSGEVVEEGTGR